MPVWLLSDPHLSKDMSKFGEIWRNHIPKIEARWRASVAPADVVLVPGDICWAPTLDEARKDLALLHDLPGEIVCVKGNHDWWWTSTAKVRRVLPPSVYVLDGEAMALGGLVLLGAKGFLSPEDPYYRPDNARAHGRALARFSRALDEARQMHLAQPSAPVIALVHYPPCTSDGNETAFSRAIEAAGFVDHCVFGHFHLPPEWEVCWGGAVSGSRGGVHYHLGSADFLDFTPKHLAALPRELA